MSSNVAPNTVLGGRYKLLRTIAAGGMAEVWLADDLSLNRKVAVKLLKAQLAQDPIVVERFRREAVAAGGLSHPNIVQVYDAIVEDGRQAVVMQFVEGMSLRQMLDEKKKLSPELTVHIGAAVAAALDHAHQNGLVHRDVKPGNILITPDGRVMLADFGIAKVMGETGEDLTNEHIMMGTAKYLSPEQVRGRPLDGRADIYALGLVLYECLAGGVPFNRGNDGDTALARLTREPTDLGRLNPTLSPALVGVIHKMLNRDPDQRPATGADARSQLKTAVTGVYDPTTLNDRRNTPPRGTTPPRGMTPPRGATPPNGTTPPSGTKSDRRDPTPRTSVAGRPGRSAQTRVRPVLALISVLVVAALAMVAMLWNTIQGGDDSPRIVESTTTSPEDLGPLKTVALNSYDPNDDGLENEDMIGLLSDDDPGTSWTTGCYMDKYFGSEVGAGVLMTMNRPGIGTLTLNVTSKPWIIEVYTASNVIPTTFEAWGDHVEREFGTATGPATFNVTSPAKYILVMFREGGRSGNCSNKNPYQASLASLKFAPGT